MNRRSLLSLSLLLPLAACVDAAIDEEEEDVDEATSALSTVVTDAVLEISGKVAGRVLEVTADPAASTLTARFEVAYASELFERFASDAASGTSTALDLAFTGYGASQAITKVAAASATMNGVTLEAARLKNGTIQLVVTVVFNAASVAIGPGTMPAIAPPVSNVSVSWQLTGVASSQIAKVKAGAKKGKAKGWQTSYFDPIGVPGGIPPQAIAKGASGTMRLTVINLGSGVTRVATIQGIYGDLGWTNDSPPAWTVEAIGDSKGMVVV